MGIIDDYYGGYENLGMHMGSDGEIDYEGAYDTANFGGGGGWDDEYGDEEEDVEDDEDDSEKYEDGEEDEEDDDEVWFVRPDGKTEQKCTRWCKDNGMIQRPDGKWCQPGSDADDTKAYNKFVKETGQRNIIDPNPRASSAELQRLLGIAWGKLSDAQKSVYKQDGKRKHVYEPETGAAAGSDGAAKRAKASAGGSSSSSCAQCKTNNKAKDCQQGCCGRCCAGPCQRHKKLR